MTLSVQDKMLLDTERRRWAYSGAKDTYIREVFSMSSTRYYQRVNALLDEPAALGYAPAVVHRLRRIRDARRELRAS